MRSRHVDRFNHDTEVDGYDADVADESNPVRDGYAATLDWVISHAAAGRDDVVVDLGTGTGNLARRLGPVARLVCVDVSTGMLDVARSKLPPGTEYVEADLLEFVERAPECDVVMSTYAIHHLVAEEKTALLEGLAGRLHAGGRLSVGDLMVSTPDVVAGLREQLAHPDVDELFADEFPWYVSESRRDLERFGLVDVRAEQTGVLSWCLAATKPPVSEHERCAACGFDGARYDDAELLAAVRDLGPRWRALIAACGTELRVRPEPEVWSALEYVAHSRDITALHAFGVEQALTLDEPTFPAIASDDLIQTAASAYGAADPDEVVAALDAEATRLARVAGDAGSEVWTRGLTIGEIRMDIRRLLEHALHDSLHHVDDVERGLAGLRRE